MYRIGIVIVNYNGIIHNQECIDSILNSSYSNIEIIIVDNKSVDSSIEELERIYNENITVIKNTENLGFAGGTNIGIKYAISNGCDYVLLLNNDTVIDKNMIGYMLKTSRENYNAVVSPKIYYYEPSNVIWSAGGEINWNRGYTIQYGMGKIDNGQWDDKREVSFATGCCILIPRRVIEKVGLIQEEYFLYFEDTDYCVNIRKCGFKIIYEPMAKMYHKVSATTGGDNNINYVYYIIRNRLLFNHKYNNNKVIPYVYILLSIMKKCAVWIFRKRYDLVKCSIIAIYDFKKKVNGKKEKIL